MWVSLIALKIVALLVLVYLKTVTCRPFDGYNAVNAMSNKSLPISQEMAKQVWMMADKFWKLDLCESGIRLKIGKRTLNKKSFYCSKNYAMKLAPMLLGDSLEDRVYVWCRMAALYSSTRDTRYKLSKSYEVDNLIYFEGDIVLHRDSVDDILAMFFSTPELQSASRSAARGYRKRNPARRKKRKVVLDLDFLWPNAEVPYHIDETFSSATRETILEAISEYEQTTCIRFVPFSPAVKSSFVNFRNSTNRCSGTIGKRLYRESVVYLGSGCENYGTITHEIGHVIGFFHEHVRPDRDDYVTVLLDNVKSENRGDFFKLSFFVETYGVPYDYSSIMHYGAFDFGGNKMTVRTKDTAMQQVIGQRVSLSFFDVKSLNIAYCSNVCGTSDLEWQECQNGGYRNPKNCESCVCPDGFSPPFCEEPSLGLNTAYTRFGGKSRLDNDRVEVDCGPQTLLATKAEQILTSPGFDTVTGFGNNAYCPWLIKASTPGKRVHLQFLGQFHFHKEPKISACEERVEVKYKELSLPGPRHCGFSTPKATYRSHGPELMVTGQTLNYTKNWQGFQASFTEENCGGCSEDSTNQEPVCFRTEKYDCSQKICAVCKFVKNTCFRDTEYCCDGFLKYRDMCIRERYIPPKTTSSTQQSTSTSQTPESTTSATSIPESATPTASALESISTPESATPTASAIEFITSPPESATPTASALESITLTPKTTTSATSATGSITSTSQTTTEKTLPTRRIPSINVWFAWSSWSACSATCGLCGVRIRRRGCFRGPCSGPVEEREICGTPVCMEETIAEDYKCTKTKKNCTSPKGWFTNSRCRVMTTCKIKKMVPTCCQGEDYQGECTIFFAGKRLEQS